MTLHSVPISVQYDDGEYYAWVPTNDAFLLRSFSSGRFESKKKAVANVIGRLQGAIRTRDALRQLLESIRDPEEWSDGEYNKWAWSKTKTREIELKIEGVTRREK